MRDSSANLFLKISLHRMTDHYLPKLTQCLQVIDTNVLWEKQKNQNSIGGITLHICEHVNRHIKLHLNLEKIEYNTGIESYFPDIGMSSSELIKFIKDLFMIWKDKMEHLINAEEINFDMHSFYHLVEHTGYHLGQIIDRIKSITGKSFNFCQNGINEKNLKERIDQI